jgi:glyoxylase-like metal-dependent hydrolase (beta-lactamase superfamily II)
VDRPWDLNGYAIRLSEATVLIDPPAPEEKDWASFEALQPIRKIVLTNRDHIRGVETFCARFNPCLVAGANETAQLAPLEDRRAST